MILRIQERGNPVIYLDNPSGDLKAGIQNGLKLASGGPEKTLYADHLLAGLLALRTPFNIFLARAGLSYDALKAKGFNLPERDSLLTDNETNSDVKISPTCAADLHSACKIAKRVEVAFVEPEHLLAANLIEPEALDVISVLEQLGINPQQLKNQVKAYVELDSKRRIKVAPQIIVPA